ncbi:MAG: NADH-quinone oxidoreductase subunit C [Actinomycetota bacterium]
MSDVADVDAPEGDEAAAATDVLPTLHGWPVVQVGSQQVLFVDRHSWRDTALALLADGWNMCADVTAVDYQAYAPERDLPVGVEPERFEVVVSLLSHERRERLRVRIQVPDDDPTVDSLYAIYPGSDFLEREVYDLMGITFTGHPDLSRILMPETWDGHPLRKDFAIGAIPVQFKAPNRSDRVVGRD